MSFKDGRIGVGKDPIFPLDISGSCRIDGDLILGGRLSDGGGNPITFGGGTGTASTPDQNQDGLPSWSSSSLTTVFDGNVGIGTTSPQSHLHLAGTGDVVLRIQADTNNSGEGDNPMIEFRQDGNLLNGVIGTGNLPPGGVSDGNDNALYIQHMGSNGIVFLSGPSQNNQSTSLERMRITPSGNVGIGYDSPDYKLDIRGSGSQIINVYSDGTGDAYARFSQNNQSSSNGLLYVGASTSSVYLNSRFDHPMVFYQNNSEVMRIHDNGNVGIGTTSPISKLSVYQGGITLDNPVATYTAASVAATANSLKPFEIRATTGSLAGDWGILRLRAGGGTYMSTCSFIDIVGFNSTDSTCIKFFTYNNERMRINSSGNVGIGTTSPGEKLEVNGNIKLGNSNGTLITDNQIYRPGNNDFHIQYGGSGDLTMCYGGGNVGIGTTSPANKLEIHGGPLGLKNGNHTATTAQQILFGFSGVANLEYAHSIRTRHNGQSSANDTQNSIDFYLWKKGDTTTTIGEKHGMSITAAGVGIGTAGPTRLFHLHNPSTTVEDGHTYFMMSNVATGTGHADGFQIINESDGAVALKQRENKDFKIFTNNSHRLTIQGGGNVGIGTTSPYMPFDCVVSKYISDADIDQYWDRGIDDGAFFRAENDGWGSSYQWNTNQSRVGDLNAENSGDRPVNLKPISAHFYDNVYISNGGLLVSSDERIKQNIIEIPDDISLKILRDISCCSYYYIDDIGRQKAPTLGFIAQQVNKIFPQAVTLTERIIPNVMKRINNFSWISDNSNNKHKLISDLQDVSGVLYRFYVSNNVDEREKKVEHKGNSDNTFTFENKWEHIFCYGYEVPDFHALDKQKLYAINFSATQELDRKVTALETVGNKDQNVKILDLYKENQELKARLAKIEAFLGI